MKGRPGRRCAPPTCGKGEDGDGGDGGDGGEDGHDGDVDVVWCGDSGDDCNDDDDDAPVHNVQFVKYIFPRNRTTSNLS